MPRGLKVYRTAIGFHDAYVAAPSQKAALAAWGTDKDLFARGAAEIVTDPAQAAPALEHPGEVIRVLRGSAAEHVKALGAVPRHARRTAKRADPPPKSPASPRKGTKPVPPPPPPPPKPSRDQIRFAEAALNAAAKRRSERLAELAEREKALAAERKRVEREHAVELARFEKRLRDAQASYDKALARWEKG